MSEKDDKTGVDRAARLTELGFDDAQALKNLQADPGTASMQVKFDQVFGQKKADATRTMIRPGESGDALPEEVELDLGGSSAPEELAMSDSELELGDADAELSLGDGAEDRAGAPLDEGLDLALDDGLELGDDADAGLALGEASDLDDDVMAKLAEIDEIMTADATATQMRPALEELSMEAQADEADLREDDLSLGEELIDGADELPDLQASEVADAAAELALGEEGFDLGGEELSIGAEELDLGGDEVLFTSEAPRRTPPPAPALADPDEMVLPDEELSYQSSEPPEPPALTAAAPPAERSAAAPRPTSTESERSGYREVVGHYNSELERLQATLTHLRNDREDLLRKIEHFEEERITHNRQSVTLRAELDEKKIEVQIMKKRFSEETQELRYQLELSEERRKLAEERGREYLAEIQNLQQKVRLEVKKVTSREAELEQRLELLKSDAETQIRHRDAKILELKRRVDSMEFEMDTLSSLEQKSLGAKSELEGKLDRAIKTLRTAIGILETDDPKLAALEKLKKGLDV